MKKKKEVSRKQKAVHRKNKLEKEIKKEVFREEIKEIKRLKKEDKTLLRLLVILVAFLIIYLVVLMATMPPGEQKTAGSNEQVKEYGEQDTATNSDEGSSEVVIEIS